MKGLDQQRKILFAAGGSGGHLFPAQALASDLLQQKRDIKVFFAGSGLTKSPYFDRSKFCYQEVKSATPFRGNIFNRIKTIGILSRGIVQSIRLLGREKPDLLIGFGSFHTFPLLFAAILKRVPFLLFEPNTIPGKVVRLFSSFATWTGVYFPEASQYLKGKTKEVEMPSFIVRHQLSREEAHRFFHLDPHLFTLLGFGGSQGAKKINQELVSLIQHLKARSIAFQLLLATGNEEEKEKMQKICSDLQIPACIKTFENRMDLAWSAADLAICRSGAATISEILYYQVPAILIPYPYAADGHQVKNAKWAAKQFQAITVFEEAELTQEKLIQQIEKWLDPHVRIALKEEMKQWQEKRKKVSFSLEVLEQLARSE